MQRRRLHRTRAITARCESIKKAPLPAPRPVCPIRRDPNSGGRNTRRLRPRAPEANSGAATLPHGNHSSQPTKARADSCTFRGDFRVFRATAETRHERSSHGRTRPRRDMKRQPAQESSPSPPPHLLDPVRHALQSAVCSLDGLQGVVDRLAVVNGVQTATALWGKRPTRP